MTISNDDGDVNATGVNAPTHAWSCECRECLGADFEQFHGAQAAWEKKYGE